MFKDEKTVLFTSTARGKTTKMGLEIYGEFWIGNDKLHLLTKSPTVLWIELQNDGGKEAFAMYD